MLTIPHIQSAVINEGLRLSHGASSRMPRIATEENLQYKQWIIPAGVSNCRLFPCPEMEAIARSMLTMMGSCVNRHQ